MSKDPAFLFYPGDWLGGTMLMTRHHKGAYMDLLMAQYNNGHMTLPGNQNRPRGKGRRTLGNRIKIQV